MGHLSLYRKHRPQTFADVVGQEHVTRTLGRAVAEGRLAHAYLFSGPRGTGKTSTARILAKCLNCEAGPTAEPCNVCVSCVEITAGRSLDVVEIDAASHGSVDDARDIREKVAYSPTAGRSRVYIVDECHMLSAAANNALLKVLEEPPAHVVFVFATTEPHKVLQTLLDRCQRYEMRAIGPEDMAARVAKVAEVEGISIEPEAIEMLAHRSGGSMRDALSLLDQLWSYAEGRITGEDLARLLGSVPEDTVTEAIDIVSDRDAGAAFLFVDRLTREGRDIRELVRALTGHLRSLFLVLHAPAAQEILDVTDLELERLRSQANRFDPNELLRLIDLANETSLALRQAVEGRLVLEVMLVRMARPDLHPSPSAMLSRIERLERLAGVEKVAGAAAAEAPALPAARAAEQGTRPQAAARAAEPGPSAAPRRDWRSEIRAPSRATRETTGPEQPPPERSEHHVSVPGRPTPPEPATRPAPAREAASAAPGPAAGLPDGGDPWAGMDAAPAAASAPPVRAGTVSADTAPSGSLAGSASPPKPVAGTAPGEQRPAPATPAPVPAPPVRASTVPADRAPSGSTSSGSEPTPKPVAGTTPGEQRPAPATPAPVPAPAGSEPTPTPVAGTAPGERGPDIDLERIRLGWDVLLEKVKKRRIAARAMLLPASPVAWRGDELVIEFNEKSRFHRDRMSDPSYQTPLSEAFHETFGVRPRIRCVLRSSGGKPAASTSAPARLEEEIDDSDTEADGDSGTGGPGAREPVQPATTGHGSAIDLVKQGFGAEIVEEF